MPTKYFEKYAYFGYEKKVPTITPLTRRHLWYEKKGRRPSVLRRRMKIDIKRILNSVLATANLCSVKRCEKSEQNELRPF